ncbi:MAG: hypothetical protein QOG60_1774 [Frankiaceae bacterium]|nr:hypothetical protein [Frankiaceae bacterium]
MVKLSYSTLLDRGSWFDPNAGRITLREYTKQWLDSRRVRGRPLAPRTRELYRWQLERHVLPSLGDVELRHLDQTAVRTWHGRLSTVRPGSCYRCQVLPAAENGRGGLLSWLAPRMVHGLRASCSSSTAVPQIVSDLPGGVRHVGLPKTVAGLRTVAIPPHVIGELREHLDRFAEPTRDGLVFVGPKGGPLRNATFGRSVWRPAVGALVAQMWHAEHKSRRQTSTTWLLSCENSMAAESGSQLPKLRTRVRFSSPAPLRSS